jgi:uncharacterized protein YijF (DUF1287 family)
MIFAIAFAAILLSFAFCVLRDAMSSIQIAFAEDQTAIFDLMRRQTQESADADVSYLEYTLWYYPSGTKQTKGSALDRVVERARQSAVREIIAELRSRTNKDFGDDPRRWIEVLKVDGSIGTKARP